MRQMLVIMGIAAFTVVAACSDPNALADPAFSNKVDTITLYSLRVGPLDQPAAYSINSQAGVRTWEAGTNFEFVYTTEPGGRALFLPIDLLGLAPASFKPGLQRSAKAFDDMRKAPLNGYLTSDTMVVAEQDRFFFRTAINTCSGLGVPLYAKLEVLDIDSTASSVTFRVITNQNCGYRSLLEGKPSS